MRGNFVFEGIPEVPEEEPEQEVRSFLEKGMNITDELKFHRVHEMGVTQFACNPVDTPRIIKHKRMQFNAYISIVVKIIYFTSI